MAGKPPFATCVVVLMAVELCFSLVPTAAQKQARLTAPIDDTVRATIARSHPVLRDATDLGKIPDGTALEGLVLVLGMSPEAQTEASRLLDSQQTRGAANYHQWLTPEQFGQQFGPAQGDLATITNWLIRQGFTVEKIARSGLWLQFSGSAGQVQKAFGAEMHSYRLKDKTYTANASDISIPASLRPVVAGVLSLNNYQRLHSALVQGFEARRTATGQYERLAPQANVPLEGGSSINALSPGDFATIYDVNPLYQGKVAVSAINGKGVGIAIVARSEINPQDVADFQSTFGLPANPPTIVHSGPDVPFDPNSGDAVEATLDTEWAGAVAPNANITVVIGGSTDTTDGVDISSAYIVDNVVAPVMSSSFAECEQNLAPTRNQFYNNLWQQAAAEGISVFVDTGDSAAAGCDSPTPPNTIVLGSGTQAGLGINGVASTPFDTAVGGTAFNETGAGEATSPGTSNATFWSTSNVTNNVTALGYIPEQVWNESCLNPPDFQPGFLCFTPGIDLHPTYVILGTGGGFSTLYPVPSWQTANVPGLGGSNFTNRAIPDVSLTAEADHGPYIICFNGGCSSANNQTFLLIGGTSASTPSFAGIMALIDQATGGPQGLANYVLYPLAAQQNYSQCNSNAEINPTQSTTCVFHDITLGNNGAPGNDVSNDPTTGATGYPAATGYDPASGLGSVDAANLVASWLTLQKGFQGTTTTLSDSGVSPIQATHGTFVPVTVDVNPDAGTNPPTGSVAFLAQGGTLANSIAVGNGTLTPANSTGTFSGSLGALPGGSYNLIAQYPGDGNFAASASAPIPVQITPENSVTTLTVFTVGQGASGSGTSNPETQYGVNVLITAAVAGASGQGTPTGQLTLLNGATQLVQFPLDSLGHATWVSCLPAGFQAPTRDTLPCLSPGTYTLTATYGGDASFNPSPQTPAASQSVSLKVDKGNPFLFGSGGSVVVNQPITLSATVENFGGTVPTGNVQFLSGTTPLGQAVVDSTGSASIQAMLPQGTTQMTLIYSGDGNWNALTQANIPVQVGVPYGFVVPSFTQTVNPGQTATFNLSLSASQGFTGGLSLTCAPPANANFPVGVSCSMPSTVSFTATTTTVPIPVTVTTSSISLAPQMRLPSAPGGFRRFLAPPLAWSTTALTWLVTLALFLALHRYRPQRARLRTAMLLAIPVCVAFTLLACGGGSSAPPAPPGPPPPPAVQVSIAITASPNPVPIGQSTDEFITLTLNINP
jgi:hypothetical protein